MDLLRRFASEAPAARPFREDKPTLLVCWWCTLYAITIILFRICGRYVRAEKLFLDDKIMLAAVIPLLGQMAFVHVVLVFGTNNTLTADLTDADIHKRTLGSGMVLLARIFDATYLWSIKYSTLMFLRSLTVHVRTGLHTRMLQGIQILLGATLLAVIISTLGECHPFSHYWQVVPDPGPSCRQAPAQFITLAIAHSFTNLALVILPIPIILMSRIPTKRKITTTLLLSLPILNVAYTAGTSSLIPASQFTQHTRSLLSSLDALLSAFVANAVVLCALLQDKGYKKSKYKHAPALAKTITKTRPRVHEPWDSDEELIMGESIAGSTRGESKVAVGGGAERDGAIEMMPMAGAKMKSIRVKQTWEVEIEEVGGPVRDR